MFIVGLTGGIASGKSLVTRVFRDLGAHIIDADKIVHGLLAPGQDVWKDVTAKFGSEIVLPDNCIDRRKLGDIVFNDPEKRDWLNRRIHPRVFEVYQATVRHIRERQPDAIVVLDAALLIETGYHKNVDRIIVVYAREEQQTKRLMERDGFTPEQALTRIKSQMSLDEKREHADYVIDNSGLRQDTERQAREVFEKLQKEALRA